MHLNLKHKYYINLKKRKDRDDHINRVTASAEFGGLQRWEATGAHEINPHDYPKKMPDFKGDMETYKAGKIACFLSNRRLLQHCMDNGGGDVMIMQDDAVLAPKFRKHFNKTLQCTPENWDVVYFGGWHVKPPTKKSEHICKLNWTTSPTLAIFREPAIKTILAETDKIDKYWDVYLMHKQSELNFYCSIKKLVWQKPDFSDIENRQVNYRMLMPNQYGM